MSALTEEQKKEVLEMIRKENKKRQQKAIASSSNFKEWLEENGPWILRQIASAAISLLWGYVKTQLGLP